MELILNAKDIRVEFKGRDVLNIDDLEVYDYDRIGLVGANGAGKSTLLKVLLGELTSPGCKMNRLGELAYIPQLDEVTLQKEKDFALVGKLGIEQLDIQTMSGGEETRLKIAQALSAQVHGILADEPTSHLDREGIDFLIGQLKYFTGALLVISHDRYFLDEVVDKIWELKDGKITEYWGNYSDYLRQKEEERKGQATEYEQFISERARLERAAEEKRKQARKIEQKAKGASKKKSTEGGGRLAHQKSIGSKEKKMHNAAKSLDHRIAALGNVEAPENISRIRFRQSDALALYNPYPIAGTEITKTFMEEVLIDDNMVFDIDNLKGFLNDTSSFGFIAKENNKIIGFAYCYTLLRPDGKTMFYLHSIGMLPNYQDKGYGSKLLSFIKEYSKEIGCSEMFLITDKGNPRACHVYEKLGGKNDYKDEIVYVYDYEKGDK
jgi:macrolide transport system ATP-binding/permease protein